MGDLEIISTPKGEHGYVNLYNQTSETLKVVCLKAEFKLVISYCTFQVFSFHIPNLTILTIDESSIPELEGLSFPRLEELTVNECTLPKREGEQLRTFSFKNNVLPMLKKLIIDGCGLQEFSWSSPTLEKLDLSSNRLKSFQGDFPRLKRLTLASNLINSFDGTFEELTSLDLSCNGLTSFGGRYPRLVKVTLNKNRISDFSADMPVIEHANIDDADVTFVPPFSHTLRVLYANRNRISNFNGCVFPNLESLSIESNQISEMVIKLPKLKTLKFKNNPVKKLELVCPCLIDF